LRYFAQFKCYHKKIKELKRKKFNLNRKIFHVKILGAISSKKTYKNNLKLE